MKFFVTSEQETFDTSIKHVADVFGTRAAAQAFIDASEWASEYEISEAESLADFLGEEIEFSSNEDGDYVLIPTSDADEAVSLARLALAESLEGDYRVDVAVSYRIDGNDDFQGDVGKWRMFYRLAERFSA